MNPTPGPRDHVYSQTNYPLPPTASALGLSPAEVTLGVYPEPDYDKDAPQNNLVPGNDGPDRPQGDSSSASETFKCCEDWSDLIVGANHITSIGRGRSSEELLLTYKNIDAIAYYDPKTRVVKKAVKHGVADVVSHISFRDCTILFSTTPGCNKNVHVMAGGMMTDSNIFEQFRDYYIAPKYTPNNRSEHRKNCTGGKNIAVYQNTFLTYMTKSYKLVMYNLAAFYASNFKGPAKSPKDYIEYDLGKVRPQAFTFETRTIKNDRIIVLLQDGMIMKFYLQEKTPHRKVTLPDSLKPGALATEIIHEDSTTIVAVNELSNFSNVFISLDRKLEVVHRLTVPNQGSSSSPSFARAPAEIHDPPKEEPRSRHQLPRVGDGP